MLASIADVINCYPRITNCSYLELGISENRTFNLVRAGRKVGVDMQPIQVRFPPPPAYNMTTDEFFLQIPESMMFDVVFIDAGHSVDNVIKDFNNTIKHLTPRGIILIHDLIPPTEEFTASWFCGDGYKFLYQVLVEQKQIAISADCEYGLTLFPKSQAIEFWEENKGVSFTVFTEELKHFHSLHAIVSLDQLGTIISTLR